jgi:hypothetical protein
VAKLGVPSDLITVISRGTKFGEYKINRVIKLELHVYYSRTTVGKQGTKSKGLSPADRNCLHKNIHRQDQTH